MKTIIRYTIYFCAVFSLRAAAQEKYWIYFTDKGTQQRAFAAKAYNTVEAERLLGVTLRTLTRRSKISTEPRLDVSDIPVAPEYIAALRTLGIAPSVQSRWLNAVSAILTDNQRDSAATFAFVRTIERVHVRRVDSLTTGRQQLPTLQKSSSSYASRLDYGASLAQVQQINVPRLHDLSITGRGVLVGMLDAGYRWRNHEALRNTAVLSEYDFIQNDTVTSNESGDGISQDEHGTMTLSTLAGYMPGQLIGPAFGASYMLGKTEYVPAELNSEEDHWVAGMEWLERKGADIVSTSLGYSEFDAGQHSYTYADMNGRTAVTTKVAAFATRKGVLLCVAMGNEANLPWHFLTSPADADSILAVGAVDGTGVVTGFSSVGPTSDGRTKPDVCARGYAVYVATPVTKGNGTYTTINGTSLSTPLVAGVAALVLSARPELTPMQLRDALRNTASNTSSPNNSIGWGIVDAYRALLYNGLLVSASMDVSTNANNTRSIGVTILSSVPLVPESLLYHYSVDTAATFISGKLQLVVQTDTTLNGGVYTFVLPKQATHFFITAQDIRGDSRVLPYRAPEMLYDANAKYVVSPRVTLSIVPPVIPQSCALAQNFPNPFNGRTNISYALTQSSHVSLTVFDMLGRVVAVLENGVKEPGYFTAYWDAPAVASGVYYYSLRSRDFNDTKKMVLVR